jgi:DNA-binding response OmpR family regulator
LAHARTALVLEDDPFLALTIEDALRDAGVAVVVICADAGSALAELEKDRPDILILDVFLADREDGWAVAELVAELCPSRPAIVFSTGAPDKIPAHVAQLGTVLEKPYSPDELVAAAARMGGGGLLARIRDALSGPAG